MWCYVPVLSLLYITSSHRRAWFVRFALCCVLDGLLRSHLVTARGYLAEGSRETAKSEPLVARWFDDDALA
jgi:hypothetical protein